MSSSNNSNQPVVPSAREALNKFKMEAAQEVGVNLKQGYNGDLTSREAGSVGGQMVKKMIEAYENGMKYKLPQKQCKNTGGGFLPSPRISGLPAASGRAARSANAAWLGPNDSILGIGRYTIALFQKITYNNSL